MCELAPARLERQTGEMKKSALWKDKASGVLEVEVGEKSKEVKYRLACKAGVLKTLYGRSDVRALVEQ
eukprot:3345541-Pleurochrysis_carterae.AAC.1